MTPDDVKEELRGGGYCDAMIAKNRATSPERRREELFIAVSLQVTSSL